MDIRAERTHEKVQNESRSVSDWTIERSVKARRSPKRKSRNEELDVKAEK